MAGWVDSIDSLDVLEKRNISCSCHVICYGFNYLLLMVVAYFKVPEFT
jgi:hypothetical protein